MRTLYSDNATVNSGHISGLCELMYERALPEATRGNIKALIFRGCDDHIGARILKHFDQALVQLAQLDENALPCLAHKKYPWHGVCSTLQASTCFPYPLPGQVLFSPIPAMVRRYFNTSDTCSRETNKPEWSMRRPT